MTNKKKNGKKLENYLHVGLAVQIELQCKSAPNTTQSTPAFGVRALAYRCMQAEKTVFEGKFNLLK
jgi:hypothetical protein